MDTEVKQILISMQKDDQCKVDAQWEILFFIVVKVERCLQARSLTAYRSAMFSKDIILVWIVVSFCGRSDKASGRFGAEYYQ